MQGVAVRTRDERMPHLRLLSATTKGAGLKCKPRGQRSESILLRILWVRRSRYLGSSGAPASSIAYICA